MPASAVQDDPTLNFLGDPWILACVEERLRIGSAWGGLVSEPRLRHDLLSSQPLCFNLFGYLRWRPSTLAAVLTAILPITVNQVVDVRLEWAPPRPDSRYPGSCFDAFIEYRSGDGGRGFIGIETKYTESLAGRAKANRLDGYCEISDSSGFEPGHGQRLARSPTLQFWLNALIGDDLAERRSYDEYALLVLSCEQDIKAREAVQELNGQRRADAVQLNWASYERLIAEVRSVDQGARSWAERFNRRYLDLSPIEEYLE